MTTEVYRKPGLGAKRADVMAGARDQARTALREAMTWSFYQWTVLALLTAIFILVALSYGGIRAELGALKSERGPEADARRDGRGAVRLGLTRLRLETVVEGIEDGQAVRADAHPRLVALAPAHGLIVPRSWSSRTRSNATKRSTTSTPTCRRPHPVGAASAIAGPSFAGRDDAPRNPNAASNVASPSVTLPWLHPRICT